MVPSPTDCLQFARHGVQRPPFRPVRDLAVCALYLSVRTLSRHLCGGYGTLSSVGMHYTARACSMQSIMAWLSKGLRKNPLAPAAINRLCMRSSSNAVMKMTGVPTPIFRRIWNNSTPPIPSICTSVIRQSISISPRCARNDSAEANVWTLSPCELIKFSMASRSDASSSTTTMDFKRCTRKPL